LGRIHSEDSSRRRFVAFSLDDTKVKDPQMRILNPPAWPRPTGYNNGVATTGKLVFVAGMVGWNDREVFEETSFAGQARQALANVVAVLAEAGAGPDHLVRLTWFVADRQDYLNSRGALGIAYREVIGRHYPAMSVIEVAGFIETGALLEIEATAVVPEES
jgi:enamine deaminase RidA (YjgF/YER057c/UK114 family)